MFSFLTRRVRGLGSLTAAALLLGAGATSADAALICWTGSDGVRRCQWSTASCGRIFAVFGNIIGQHPEWDTRCYDIGNSTSLLPPCESCVSNYAPGIDGGALVGPNPGVIADGRHHFILHDSGALQVFIRHPGVGLFVADLPSPPNFGPGTTTVVHVHQAPDPRTWLPFPPFGGLPPTPVVGADFVLHFGSVDDLTGQMFAQFELAMTFSQLVFRAIPPACPADFNRDGVVNTADLTTLLGSFGSVVTPFTSGDCDGDGVVTTNDLVIFLGGFGTPCAVP